MSGVCVVCCIFSTPKSTGPSLKLHEEQKGILQSGIEIVSRSKVVGFKTH